MHVCDRGVRAPGSCILNIVFTERLRFARPGDADPSAALVKALQDGKARHLCKSSNTQSSSHRGVPLVVMAYRLGACSACEGPKLWPSWTPLLSGRTVVSQSMPWLTSSPPVSAMLRSRIWWHHSSWLRACKSTFSLRNKGTR